MKCNVKFRAGMLCIFGLMFVLGFTSASIEYPKIKTKQGRWEKTKKLHI